MTKREVEKRGRPAKYKTVKELEDKIEEYFNSCISPKIDKEGNYVKDKNGNQVYEIIRPFTVTGLALALDTTRETLLDYEKNNKNFKEFSDTIKKAKAKIENFIEEQLFGKNVVGVIFNLKNNFKWVDKTQNEIETGKEISTLFEIMMTKKHDNNKKP